MAVLVLARRVACEVCENQIHVVAEADIIALARDALLPSLAPGVCVAMAVGEEESMMIGTTGGAVHHLEERFDALVVFWQCLSDGVRRAVVSSWARQDLENGRSQPERDWL